MAHIRRVAMAHARASLRDLVDDVKKTNERVKLTRYNRTLVGIVPADDLHLLEECKRERAEREQAARPRAPQARSKR